MVIKINMKKNMKIYGICIGVMSLLVAVALLLPQIVFTIQDRHQMTRIKAERRNSLNISQMNSIYEKQMYARMNKVAAMDRETINITSVDYDIKEEAEIQVMLERISNQEWIDVLNEIIFYPIGEEFGKAEKDVKESKKYIVYGSDYQEGVVLMMWYFDIRLIETNIRVRILVDSETDSIYYIKITTDDELIDKKYDKDNEASTSNAMDVTELLYAMAYQMPYYMDFYYTYYEAEVLFDNAAKVENSEQQCMVECPFLYGELSLDFQILVSYENGMSPNISIGITNIENLIPEMIQD